MKITRALLFIVTYSCQSFANGESFGSKISQERNPSATNQQFSFAKYARYVEKTRNDCQLIGKRRRILNYAPDCIREEEQSILEDWIKEKAGFPQLDIGHPATEKPIADQDEKVAILKKKLEKKYLNEKEESFALDWQARIVHETRAIVHSYYLNGVPDKSTRELFSSVTPEDLKVVQNFLRKFGNSALKEICGKVSTTFFKPFVEFIPEPAQLLFSERQYFCQNENGINEEKSLSFVGKCVEKGNTLFSYFRVAIAKVESSIEMKKEMITVRYVIAFDHCKRSPGLESFPQVVASFFGTYLKRDETRKQERREKMVKMQENKNAARDGQFDFTLHIHSLGVRGKGKFERIVDKPMLARKWKKQVEKKREKVPS